MIKSIYAAARFLFEVASIAIAGYWGFTAITSTGWRYGLMILAPLVLMLVWRIWLAPNSAYRLQGLWRMIAEIIIYLIIAVLLYHTKLVKWALPFIVFGFINAAVNHFSRWYI